MLSVHLYCLRLVFLFKCQFIAYSLGLGSTQQPMQKLPSLTPPPLALPVLQLTLPWRNQLCDPELVLSPEAASLNLWAVPQPGGGGGSSYCCKKGGRRWPMPGRIAATSQPWGALELSDQVGQWLHNSLQIHTPPLKEKNNSWAQFHASPSNTSIAAICLKKQGRAWAKGYAFPGGINEDLFSVKLISKKHVSSRLLTHFRIQSWRLRFREYHQGTFLLWVHVGTYMVFKRHK